MTGDAQVEAQHLVTALLSHPDDEHDAWLRAHQPQQGLALIAALKREFDELLVSDPVAAERVSRVALAIARHNQHEPLAHALAAWVRGNYECYHNPILAIEWYQQSIAAYRAAGMSFELACLLTNIIAPLSECGRFAEAYAAYDEAHRLWLTLGDSMKDRLQALQQNYGVLLYTQGDYAGAVAAYQAALALAEELDRPEIGAEVRNNLTITLGMLGRLEEAEEQLQHAYDQSVRHQQALTAARVALNLGELYAAQGRVADALHWFHDALALFTRLDVQMEVGTVLLHQAMLFDRLGLVREARRRYARARGQFEAMEMWPQVGIILIRLAMGLRDDGAYAQAAQLLDEAEALWRQLDNSLWLSTTLLDRAELALLQHQPRQALALLAGPLPAADNPLIDLRRTLLTGQGHEQRWHTTRDDAERDQALQAYAQVLAQSRAHHDRWMERESLAGLGRARLAQNPRAARELLDAAATIDDHMRMVLSVEELKSSFQAQVGDVLPLLVRICVEQSTPLDALAYAWRAKGSALLEMLQQDEQHAQPVDAEISQLRQQLATYRLQAALAATEDAPDMVREREDPTIATLEQRLYELRRQRNATLARPSTLAAAGLAQTLSALDDQTLIEYMACDDQLLALVARADGSCRAVALGPTAPILDLLDELHLSVENFILQPQERRIAYADLWLQECLPALQQCYDLLIAPLGPLGEGERLLIAPCAPLYLLPFAALWDDERYLCERFELELIPCGALLALPPEPAATDSPLVIAAPAEGRLAAVALEAEAITRVFPASTCLLDNPTDLERLKALREPPQLLHIASHSVLRADAPIFSALQLTGGLLSIEQCYDLTLRGAEVVVLSGCSTAAGLDSGGALLAFQSAFLCAGAQRVVSSLWIVDDQATARSMALFYEHLSAGMAPAAALRLTQRALLQDAAFAHPAIWASFICCRR